MPGEFQIIREHFRRKQRDAALLVGIGDDGAVLRPREDHDLVVVTDTIVRGRHFPERFAAADIGWRALAVNLSDIAAMGAAPRFAFLNLALEEADDNWLRDFAGGFFSLAEQSGTLLAGGDTVRGPLSVTVTVIGEVARDAACTRAGARAGDYVCVTGTPGDAAAGLELLQAGADDEHPLVRRFRRPEPRLRAGRTLAGIATAMIDVSDGLLADLGHVLEASGAGARIEVSRLPVSAALADHAEKPAEYVLAGGDDYELCFTVPEERLEAVKELDCRVSIIGRITAERGLRVLDANGREWRPERRGWDHFRNAHG